MLGTAARFSGNAARTSFPAAYLQPGPGAMLPVHCSAAQPAMRWGIPWLDGGLADWRQNGSRPRTGTDSGWCCWRHGMADDPAVPGNTALRRRQPPSDCSTPRAALPPDVSPPVETALLRRRTAAAALIATLLLRRGACSPPGRAGAAGENPRPCAAIRSGSGNGLAHPGNGLGVSIGIGLWWLATFLPAVLQRALAAPGAALAAVMVKHGAGQSLLHNALQIWTGQFHSTSTASATDLLAGGPSSPCPG